MWPILWWITSVFLDSVATGFYKRALEVWTTSKVMFKILTFTFAIIMFLVLSKILWFDLHILLDYKILIFIWFISLVHFFSTMLWMSVYKKAKLSDLLPYDNIDKLFIVIIWYFLYSWIEWKEVNLIVNSRPKPATFK